MFGSNVAPRRKVREKPKAWRCPCGVSLVSLEWAWHPGYLTACPDCGTRRDDVPRLEAESRAKWGRIVGANGRSRFVRVSPQTSAPAR